MPIAPRSRYEPLGAARDLAEAAAEALRPIPGGHDRRENVLNNLYRLVADRRAHGFYGIGNPDYGVMVEHLDASASAMGDGNPDVGYDRLVDTLRDVVEGHEVPEDRLAAARRMLGDLSRRLAA